MITVSIFICDQGVDSLEIHSKTQFAVGFPLCKYGTCIFGKKQNCNNSIFVHKGQFNNEIFFEVDWHGYVFSRIQLCRFSETVSP